MKTYRLTDRPILAECEALNIEQPSIMSWTPPDKDGRKITAVKTAEFRTPRAGEWYLSGALPTAWRAPNDLTQEFHILRLVVVNRQTHT